VTGVDQPLAGIRVLDLTTFLSGPFCTQILGDLGATVTKVESLQGDASRHIPPHFVEGDSAYFLAHNRNKRSVAVDLKAPEGQELALRLVAVSDVVVENFRPGVCERLGLDPKILCAERPELIWASISGFGQDGPWRDRPAYDIVVQALSGVMSLTGLPGGPAMRLGIPAGDLVAGLYAAMAVLASVAARERTGRGRIADISMLDSQLSMLSYQAVYATVSGQTPPPQGSRHDSIPTYRSFSAQDGRELVVAANTHRMWTELCGVLGLHSLVEDPRFTSGRDRLRHEDALGPLLEAAFRTRPAHEWVDLLVERSVPSALIKTVPEALEDARVAGRSMVVPIASPAGRIVETVGTPIKFTGGAEIAPTYPAALGEHSDHVLAEIGYTDEMIETLRFRGVLGTVERTQS
jgi:CoA:oxalate CoA-transferase